MKRWGPGRGEGEGGSFSFVFSFPHRFLTRGVLFLSNRQTDRGLNAADAEDSSGCVVAAYNRALLFYCARQYRAALAQLEKAIRYEFVSVFVGCWQCPLIACGVLLVMMIMYLKVRGGKRGGGGGCVVAACNRALLL